MTSNLSTAPPDEEPRDTVIPFGTRLFPPFNHGLGQRRMRRFVRACAGVEGLIILTHNDPDPDAVASAWGIQTLLVAELGIKPRIVYGGIIGRAENRALVRELQIELTHVDGLDWQTVGGAILVDTQERATNHALAPGVPPVAVFDHHQRIRPRQRIPFRDVRVRYGATSTLVTEYLVAANLPPQPALATALFYGIKTDTRGLARGATDCDAWAYMILLPLMDRKLLAAIEQARVPRAFFQVLSDALARTVLYDNVVLANLGNLLRPDMAAEIADILSRLDHAGWVICMGRYQAHVVLAVRTSLPQANAARLVQQVVGDLGGAGGHTHMAGGRVRLGSDPERLEQELHNRFLHELGVEHAVAQSLIT